MKLQMIAPQVLDVAANEQAIAYVRRDTKADGSVFASFHFCDWETLQRRPIAESTYLNIKFGEVGGAVADKLLGEVFSCRAAPLPDGGCAVLRAGGALSLFRPNGVLGGTFALEYKACPAYDLVGYGGDIWFTAPTRDALVLFSLERRDMILRVGGENEFQHPMGLTKRGHTLFACCAGSKEVKTLLLPSYTFGESVSFAEEPTVPEQYFSVFRRNFVWIHKGLYAMNNE